MIEMSVKIKKSRAGYPEFKAFEMISDQSVLFDEFKTPVIQQ